jgi:hypothetical protein
LGQISNSNILAELKVETIEDISTIIARGLNRTEFYYNLRYVFSVVTFDKDYEESKLSLEEFLKSEDVVEKTLEDFINSNNASRYSSKEKAEDFFSLDPYQSKDLFRISLETGIENKIIIMLLLYDEDDNILATSRVIFNESTEEKEAVAEAPLPRDNFELTGLVVEETLTKNGRDFYERFYFHYSYNDVKGDEVVVIDEMFTFRTRTKIIVKIGDEEIISFFGSSNEEFIDEMAKVSVQKVYQYFENKKKEKSYITRY